MAELTDRHRTPLFPSSVRFGWDSQASVAVGCPECR
jgi:hypothetical protein